MRRLLETNSRLLLLGILLAPLALCDTLTLTFSGIGSGTLGAHTFTDSAFTFTFSSDTTSLTSPAGYPNDISTPAGTPATFTIDDLGISGSLTGDQAVFVNDHEDDVGIWVYQPPDFLTLGNFSFSNYKLNTDVVPPIGGTASALSGFLPTSIEGKLLSITSLSKLDFTAMVGDAGSGSSGDSAVPEPSTLSMVGLALGCLLIGKLRPHSAS